MRRCGVLLALSCLAWPSATRADAPARGDDTWSYASHGDLALDAELALGYPVGLGTGLLKGVGAGFTWGRWLTLGARAAWMTTTESSLAWSVTHDSLPLRLSGSARAQVGRGAFGLRLGIGATVVHESRVRNQGQRAGLRGSELSSSSWALLPAIDLDAVVELHVAGPWLVVLSGGPSVERFAGSMHAGWNGQLGVAWQP